MKTAKDLLDAIRKASDLDALQEAILAAESRASELETAGWRDGCLESRESADDLRHELEHALMYLPTFGGPDPDLAVEGIASWDSTRVMWIDDSWHITDRYDV